MRRKPYLVCLLCLYAIGVSTQTLDFYEEPGDTYLTKNAPAILKCKIENARTIFFKCNEQWSQEPSNGKLIQIGNKQILSIELAITRSQLDDYKKSLISADSYLIPEFWCTCQGWLNSADDTIISRKAYVKLACKFCFSIYKNIWAQLYYTHGLEWIYFWYNYFIGFSKYFLGHWVLIFIRAVKLAILSYMFG